MKFSRTLGEEALSHMLVKAKGPLVELYENVRRSIGETRQEQDYGALWAKLAPSGNIYRYLAYRAEERRHRKDLGKQLLKLAEQHKSLLGGDAVALKRRAARLCELLGKAKPENIPDIEEGEETQGFFPLQEFLDDPTSADNSTEISGKTYMMAVLVGLIQSIAPFLVLLNCWFKDYNQLRDPHKIAEALTMHELMCVGKNLGAGLTTIMGTMMLVVIYTIILNYAEAERANARKVGRLPMDNIWTVCGDLANASCCLVISLAIPLQLWGEDGPTGIIMDSMALLFVFTFDDLSSDAFGYLGLDDASFEQQLSWYYSLLSSCPVQLGDVIQPDAASAEDLWKISYDDAGRLLTATPKACLCATRIRAVADSEDTPLVKKEEDMDALPEIRYQVHPGGRVQRLPGWKNVFTNSLWEVVVLCLRVIWWVVPVVWFCVNKPCERYS